MKSEDIQQSLTHLHEELQRTTKVDVVTRQALAVVLDDIRRLIGNPLGNPSASNLTEPSLASKLGVMIKDFETKHPQLTGVLQKVVDQLAEMGI